MRTQVNELDNDHGIKISAEALSEAGLSIEQQRHISLEERASLYGGSLKLDGEYEWGNPVGREIW